MQRGGKGTDYEGGVATAAFVTGGALPSHLYGQASDSPMHVADLHFTICLLAGLSDAACRDDDIPGVPPVDGIDFRAAFEQVNVTRPISNGKGASAGTQEILLSTNGGNGGDQPLTHTGAYIDFNLSNGGPWKYVWNTSHVLKNAASPLGSGYWTGPLWPDPDGSQTKGTAPGFEPDVACPVGGCLFNLRLDRTEHREFSSEQPELRDRMAKRMIELRASRFQTSINYTGGFDNCSPIGEIVAANRGFVGPCCTKGESWSAEMSCAGHRFERFGVADYRGTWRCDDAAQALTAMDDAGTDGAAIGFARLLDVAQPPSAGDKIRMSAGIKLGSTNDSASCYYTSAGLIVGMGASAGSDYRDQFSGYSVAITPPNCRGRDARLTLGRHDVGATHGADPSFESLATASLGETSTAEWVQLQVEANSTHISATLGDGAVRVEAALVPGKPVGCSAAPEPERGREPWEPALAGQGGAGGACSVGVYQHRATASWRGLSFRVVKETQTAPKDLMGLDRPRKVGGALQSVTLSNTALPLDQHGNSLITGEASVLQAPDGYYYFYFNSKMAILSRFACCLSR